MIDLLNFDWAHRTVLVRPSPDIGDAVEVRPSSPHAVHVLPASETAKDFLDCRCTMVEICLVAEFRSFHQRRLGFESS